MERIIDNGRFMRMKVVESKAARFVDAAAPAIALVGGSVRDIDMLESVILDQGFRLFDQDAAGAATITPDVVVMDVGPDELAGQIEERLRGRADMQLSDRARPWQWVGRVEFLSANSSTNRNIFYAFL